MNHVEQLTNENFFNRNLRDRKAKAGRWNIFFFATNLFAIAALITLLLTIINSAMGYVVMRYTTDPATLSSKPLDDLSTPELIAIVGSKLQKVRLRVLFRNELVGLGDKAANLTTAPMSELLQGKTFPAELQNKLLGELSETEIATILGANLSRERLVDLINTEIVKPVIVDSWNLYTSLVDKAAIEAEVAKKYPEDSLEFHSWLNLNFITRPIASTATTAGLRTALLGSLWIIAITVIVAIPLGIGAAIYLEEYATDNWFNRLIETNIRNLAGVPSIIYGMLGLAVFARTLGHFTSGAAVGVTDSNGRTVLSAALTMALVILPVVIINAQEAIRAVPRSIREASYGVGATKLQTIRHQVLPAAFPGILTGLILSVSRAIGETAPLIVVGASTFIGVDPNGPFSKFTVVPIQIYQWTSRPELEFKNVAAAAIIVLLILMLSFNTLAIVLRQYFSRRLAAV